MVVKKEATMNLAESILREFAELEDFRVERNRIHPLMNIVTIAVLAVMCGADSWVDVERYGQAKKEWLSQFLDLSYGIPSHDTFGRVFRWVDSEAFQACFARWTARLCKGTKGQLIPMDGKKLRRSGDKRHGRDGIWIVSAWASENQMVLGQKKVDEKSNEITAIPELLAHLDLTDCVVTLDALNTQTTIAKQIVDAQADYILALKANHSTLYEDVIDLFDGFEEDAYQEVLFDTAHSITEAHGREEFRQVWVVSEPSYRDYLRRGTDWKKLTSLVKLVTVRNDETTTRYFMSSWSASAQQFLAAIRAHWQIENGLHWVLDIAFREDESRIRKDHAPQNMALLRHFALNLLKQETSAQVGIAAKRKMAGWDNNYLLKVVCP
jgi:predicted transposase YbfD/YdcC